MTFISFFEFVPGLQSAPSKNTSVTNNQSRTNIILNNFKQQIAVLEPFHSTDFEFNEFNNAAKKIEKSVNNYEFSLNLDDNSVTLEILKTFRIIELL